MNYPLNACKYVGFCLLFGCNSEVTNRSDVPVPPATALKDLGIALPASANHIYYLHHEGGLQDLERYIRFDLAPSDLPAAVESLIATNNRTMRRRLSYPKLPITAADFPEPRSEFQPMRWWTPGSVTRGYYRGHTDSYALRILVDEQTSRIYVYEND